ncbi:hypothetical protein [Streptomyces sp. NPDC090025]|uniref:hypothetical protein n=1 Tax=Streptomyces sp. NPDC090025 TaxID=3365922 RepID=UPI0038330721
MAWYEGPCRITVIGVDADYPQRAVVTVRGPGGARTVIPGTVGAVAFVDAPSWDLDLEHEFEGRWRPNVRAVTSRWSEVGGIRTQTVRSKDVDQPRDRRERNLVLRLERTGEPVAEQREAERSWDAPSRWTTESGAHGTSGRSSGAAAPTSYGGATSSSYGTPSTGGSSGTNWHVPRQSEDWRGGTSGGTSSGGTSSGGTSSGGGTTSSGGATWSAS